MPSSLATTSSAINQSSREHASELRAVVPTPERSRPLYLVIPEGQIQVHTAPFRGSFSGVLSEALRAAGLGSRVMVAQFLKGGVNQGPKGIVSLCDRMEWIRPDIPWCVSEQEPIQSSDSNNETVKEAIKQVWETCRNRLLAKDLDQLVLDEIGLAIRLGFLKEEELISALEQRPDGMDVILTGPSIPLQIMNMSDQVTKLRCCS